MNKKLLKIYVYPFLIIITSVAPWLLFAKFILKIDFDLFISQSLNCETLSCIKNCKLFMVVSLVLIYCGWVSLNMWLENSKSTFERERKIESFALNYGKAFIGLIVGQFILIIISATLIFSR
jgi:hypothetical protein